MRASDWNWALTIAGTVASFAGVVFSWLAWVQAGKARDAAREATDAVRKRNTAQDLLRLAGDAKEFLAAIQQGRIDNAISGANGLVHALAIVRSRSVVGTPDARAFKSCENEIMTVTVGLHAYGIPEDQSALVDLLGRCHEIHRTVCELAGRLERLAEGATQ